jgi:hypothetical protein
MGGFRGVKTARFRGIWAENERDFPIKHGENKKYLRN